MFTEELPWLSQNDKTLIMGEALGRWFNWAASPAAWADFAGPIKAFIARHVNAGAV
jgi:hypothetical protein